MAENTVGNVEVAVTGHVYFAEKGTTLPDDATTTLAAGYVNVGYLSDDGVNEAQSRDTNEITSWGGTVVRTIQTKYGLTYSFTMLETSEANLELFYGDADVITADPLPHKIMVVEWEDGDKIRRNVYPDVQITETGERKLATTEAAAFPVTVTCYPDTDGNHGYMYRSEDEVS